MKKKIALNRVYTLLESGPVVMITTSWRGKQNVMPISWHTMIDFNPPLVGCVIGDHSHTFKAIKETRECVINIPTAAIGAKVKGCGSVSGAKVDKILKFCLKTSPAKAVKAPLLDDCFASFECKLVDDRMARKYNFFIFRVVNAWLDVSVKKPVTMHHLGGDSFMLAGRVVKVRSAK